MKFEFDINKPLEQNIRAYLTAVRELHSTNYRVTSFVLFTDLNLARTAAWLDWGKKNPLQRFTLDAGIPVATYNKTIGDMKKVGMIGTTKGGEEVFLSNAAWELHLQTITTDSSKEVARG